MSSTVAAAAPAGQATAADRPSRLPSLTGLRFVAAFCVFGFHIQVLHVLPHGRVSGVADWVFGPGAAGVSFFFVLSGFVLTWSARPGDTARRFWQRRVAKIYPNHVVTWLVTLGVAVTVGSGVTVVAALANLFLVHPWIPDPAVYFGMNSVSWSLGCEAFFYALFPLLYRGVTRVPARALWPGALAALAGIWGVVGLVQLVVPAGYHYWAIWLFPVARTPEFVAGMFLARIVREDRWPRLYGVWPATVLAAGAYLSSRWLPGDMRIVAFTAVPLALLVAAVGAADAAGRPTPWRTRWAVWLGDVSFAFYLVHQMVLRLAVRLAGGPPHSLVVGVGLALGALTVAVAGSWLLYHFVELPGMRWFGPRRRVTRG